VNIECLYLKEHYSIRLYHHLYLHLHLWGAVPSAVSWGNHLVFFKLLFKLVQRSLGGMLVGRLNSLLPARSCRSLEGGSREVLVLVSTSVLLRLRELKFFFYRRRSSRDRMQGSSGPSKVVEALVYSTPDALLVLTSGSLCPEGGFFFRPWSF